MRERQNIQAIFLFFLLILSVAIAGYKILLDISLIDAVYMAAITISTVGFSEVTEMNSSAKIFSILVIVVSISTVGVLFSSVAKYYFEGINRNIWRRKKLERQIKRLKNHFIICGAGETGQEIIKQLIQRKTPFVVIDKNEDAVQALLEKNITVINDDATKEEVLTLAGISKAKGLATTLSSDAENVYVVLTARELNPGLQIVSRAHERFSFKKLKRAGANKIVSPNEIGGKKLASMLIKPSVSNFMDHIVNTGDISLEMDEINIVAKSFLVGKKIRDSEIGERTGLVVLAIRKAGDKEEFIFNPKADTVLNVNDNLIVIGEKEQIHKLEELAHVEN